MKKTSMFRTIATSVFLYGAMTFPPLVVHAQEAEKKDMPGMEGHGHMKGGMHGNPEMHAQMQKTHQEMQAESNSAWIFVSGKARGSVFHFAAAVFLFVFSLPGIFLLLRLLSLPFPH